jgi:hypothetical protein
MTCIQREFQVGRARQKFSTSLSKEPQGQVTRTLPSTRLLQTHRALSPHIQGGRVTATCNARTQPRNICPTPWSQSLGRKRSQQPNRNRPRQTHASVISPADPTISVTDGKAIVGEDEGVIDWRQRWSVSPNDLLVTLQWLSLLLLCSVTCIAWRTTCIVS